MSPSTISVLDTLAGARHADPFSVLGPHVEHGRLVVRAMPFGRVRCRDARRSSALEMQKLHPAGIFEASIADGCSCLHTASGCPIPAGSRGGRRWYGLGRVLSDYDLYLFGEGNHTRIYDKLGAHPIKVGGAVGVHFCGVGPQRRSRQRRRRFQRVGRTVHPMRSLGASGVLGNLHPGGGAR